MAADAQVPSLAFLVSRTRRCNVPPLQWGSIGVRIGVHVAWAIWVMYGGARPEGWGMAGMIPVGIVVAVMTESHPVGIHESTLARSGGIIEVVVAIMVAVLRRVRCSHGGLPRMGCQNDDCGRCGTGNRGRQ
jgi:hypothetical protein